MNLLLSRSTGETVGDVAIFPSWQLIASVLNHHTRELSMSFLVLSTWDFDDHQGFGSQELGEAKVKTVFVSVVDNFMVVGEVDLIECQITVSIFLDNLGLATFNLLQ